MHLEILDRDIARIVDYAHCPWVSLRRHPRSWPSPPEVFAGVVRILDRSRAAIPSRKAVRRKEDAQAKKL
jgi:hypothetical protein